MRELLLLSASIAACLSSQAFAQTTDESAFLSAHHFENLDPSVSLGLHAEGDWKLGRVPLNVLLRYAGAAYRF